MWVALLIPLAYLIGTVPSALWVGRANGLDIRTVGSGNPGASNITRVLGWRRGLYVFALDTAKGAVATGIGLLASGRPLGYLLGGVAIIGHVFPVWTKFRGGKGVATGGGVFAVMSPFVFAGLVALWFAISKISKKASLASIVILILLPVSVGIVRRDLFEIAATIGICVLVMSRHLGNIKRLATRSEPALRS